MHARSPLPSSVIFSVIHSPCPLAHRVSPRSPTPGWFHRLTHLTNLHQPQPPHIPAVLKVLCSVLVEEGIEGVVEGVEGWEEGPLSVDLPYKARPADLNIPSGLCFDVTRGYHGSPGSNCLSTTPQHN